MQLKRTRTLLIELVDEATFDLEALLSSSPSLGYRPRWLARAAHSDEAIELEPQDLALLAACAASEWCSRAALEDQFGASRVARLLRDGLLLDQASAAAEQRCALDDWNTLAAVSHRHLRWRGQDARQAVAEMEARGEDLLSILGTPPPLSKTHPDRQALLPLQEIPIRSVPEASSLEALTARRATCRNFASKTLPLAVLTELLWRVYGARALSQPSGVQVMKRSTASAGGLHAVEAYLLVQGSEGLQPGLYHYLPTANGLELLSTLSAADASTLALRAVAGQDWFADAPVMVVLAARFARNHWKYRRHAKSYRAMVLDAGHLSHQQYLVATELGLGAFVTAAINEGDIEDAFGLDPMQEGVLAVTGFGYRGERMDVLEFDPLRRVWPQWTPD